MWSLPGLGRCRWANTGSFRCAPWRRGPSGRRSRTPAGCSRRPCTLATSWRRWSRTRPTWARCWRITAGWTGIEAYTVEAAGASGAAAFHLAVPGDPSGFVDVALVVGVEKYTDMVGPGAGSGRGRRSTDYDYEAVHGLIPTAPGRPADAALPARIPASRARPLANSPLLAHANAVSNPNAMFRKAISREAYERAEMVCDPLNLFDVAPYATARRRWS